MADLDKAPMSIDTVPSPNLDSEYSFFIPRKSCPGFNPECKINPKKPDTKLTPTQIT